MLFLLSLAKGRKKLAMIDCVSCETSHFFGNAVASQHRLRYRVFIQRQGWNIPSFRGMEYDEYDNPATTYLIWRDEKGEARAVSRLYPTDRPYMLRDHWPNLVTEINLPSTLEVWEGTRFGIDRDLAPDLRRKIVGEIVCAYLEFSLQENIKHIIGIMPPLIWRAIFVRSGWSVRHLGEPRVMGGDKVVAGIMDVSKEALTNVRRKTGNKMPVLRTADTVAMEITEQVA